MILGHEIVGIVVEKGENVEKFEVGQRVGVPWLGWACGKCDYCLSGKENLCRSARYTGYNIDGGFAEYTLADSNYCFAVPDTYSELDAAPLLCAGLIGYRAYTKCGGGVQRLGLYGFGASAHVLSQVAIYEGKVVYAFTRPSDEEKQVFARSLGTSWAGGSDELPPQSLDAAIIFAPAGVLIPAALKAVRPGGVVVCAGIYMSDIPSFPYELLWEERIIRSVANLTRQDGEEFITIASQVPLKMSVSGYELSRANAALEDLRMGKIKGAAVLIP